MQASQIVQPIKVASLEFDPQNPRLPTLLYDKEDGEVFRYMLEKGNLLDLIQSIGSQGFFLGEPLLVVKSANDKYYVIEGNRRLAALKLLLNPEDAPTRRTAVKEAVDQAQHHPTEVPCILYESKDDIEDYLGYRHITGVQSWNSLAKARFLSHLFVKETRNGVQESEAFKKIAKRIGTSSTYARKLVSGFELFKQIESNNYFHINSLDESNLDFSLLTTAISFEFIGHYLTSDELPLNERDKLEKLENLTKWLFEQNQEGNTRVGESRNITKLNSIIKHPDALRRFNTREISIEEAALYTDQPYQVFKKLLNQSLSKIKEAYKQAGIVQGFEDEDLEMLESIRKIARSCKAIIDDQLQSE